MVARQKILRLIKERGLNRAQLASEVGVAYSTLRSYLEPEKARLPTVDTAIRIARVLGVPSDWLWDDQKGWPPPQAEVSGDLSWIDTAVLLEEALRRKRAARAAYDKLWQTYQEVKAYYQEALLEYESGERAPSQDVDERGRSLWARFQDANHVLLQYWRVWVDFEALWETVMLADVNENGPSPHEEMFGAFRKVCHEGPLTEVKAQFRELLAGWADSSVSEHAIDEATLDLLTIVERSLSLASQRALTGRARKRTDGPIDDST